MTDTDSLTNWLEIDRSAARHNVRRLHEISGRPVLAVVKANAYGHGMLEFARAAVEAGAPWLGVARVEEALVLREAGLSERILVLGYTSPERVPEAVAANITLAVASPETASAYSAAAAGFSRPLVVHAKIDTGMGRLGVLPQDGVPFVQHLNNLPGLDVEGIFTHYARADEPDLSTTQEQLDRFLAVLHSLDSLGLRPRLVHSANSAAALYFPDTRFDLIRPGIAMYGLDPSPEAPCPPDFRKVLAWKTRLASVKNLPAGHGVGYGHKYVTSKIERVGVIAVGYADGMRRKVGVNWCIVGGKKVPFLGGVCMDQCMIPLDDVPGAKVGDEVVLIGQQGDQRITAEDIAAKWETINYEVTCGLANRVPRIYLS